LEADVGLWEKFAGQCGQGPGEALTELNQKLEGVMVALWEDAIVIERLSKSARKLLEEIRSPKVIPFARPVSA